MMGKSLELLGMVSVQAILAITIASSVLSSGDKPGLDEFTQASAEGFIREISAISAGQKADFDKYEVTEYLMQHLDGDGKYSTKVSYTVDGFPTDGEDKEMDKLHYISSVLQGMGQIQAHESTLNIESIIIEPDRRHATAYTTTNETGIMPVPQYNGEIAMVPMQAQSYCEQILVLNEKKIMQLANATCTTDIEVSPAGL